jgi:hypothetical protein
VLSARLKVTLFNWYVSNMLWRYLIAAYWNLSWMVGMYGIIVSVKVGFLKLDICMLYSVLCIEMSKQRIALFDSVSFKYDIIRVTGYSIMRNSYVNSLVHNKSKFVHNSSICYITNYFTNSESLHINTRTEDTQNLRLLYKKRNNVALSCYSASYNKHYAIYG